ncbi:copper chaperone PCu(A)C [Modestobacter versicolor]|uniref:copper chaperone PCu(A)C n=1 Tax=Modestobacter versicolor TaxID=429133 RepID=UPI0034DE41F0
MNRAPRAAAMGVLLLSPIALTACSAGQVAQTATQDRDKIGAQGSVGDLALRAFELPYPTGGVYPSGGDARLLGAIANPTPTDDTLVSIEGEDFEGVEVVDPSAAETVADGAASGSVDLTVPAADNLFLGNGDGPSVTLVGLAEEIGVGQYVDVTFTFEEAGEITLPIPVGYATRDLPRGEPFDFHGDEEGGENSGREESAEGGEGSEGGSEGGSGGEEQSGG